MIIMKFGGSSLGTSDALTRVAGLIVDRQSHSPVVVVSALGKTTDGLASVVEQVRRGRLQAALRLVTRFRDDVVEAAGAALIDGARVQSLAEKHANEMDRQVRDLVAANGGDHPAVADTILSHGERISSLLVTWLLLEHGLEAENVDASDVVVTNDRFGAATPLLDLTYSRVRARVLPLTETGRVVVMGGFIARSADGRRTTLGRGGSDFTASLVGAGLDADEIQIWTDVDGVMTADPSVVKEAWPLRHLSYAEASELAYFGARVLHPSTMLPAMERDIPVRVLNSQKPGTDGTLILSDCPPSQLTVKSIGCKRGITVIDVISTRMLMAHGFLAAIFEVFDRYQTAVDVVSTSEVGVSLTIDHTDRLHALTSELARIAEVRHTSGQAIICLVGDALRYTPGVAAKVFTALASTNVRMISQSSSRRNVSIVVDERDVRVAVHNLHSTFFGKGDKENTRKPRVR